MLTMVSTACRHRIGMVSWLLELNLSFTLGAEFNATAALHLHLQPHLVPINSAIQGP